MLKLECGQEFAIRYRKFDMYCMNVLMFLRLESLFIEFDTCSDMMEEFRQQNPKSKGLLDTVYALRASNWERMPELQIRLPDSVR